MSPRSSCRVAGRGARRAWSWSGVGSVAWAARACSLVSWSVYLFHCISFRCGFRCPDECFRALTAACFVFVLVPFCAFPSALVCHRLACAFRCGGEAGGSFPVPLVSSVWRRGGGRLLACPCSSGLRGGRCRPSRPVPAYRSFATGNGEAVMLVVPSRLLGCCGVCVDVRRLLPVPVAVRVRSDEMRLGSVAWRHHRVSAVACLPYRLAPFLRHGGRGGRRGE